jgi:cell shape-determining protein MreC
MLPAVTDHRMRTRSRAPRKSFVFAMLMVAAALALLLPDGCTAWLDGARQPLAFLQWLVAGGARSSSRLLSAAARDGVSRAEFERLAAENAALRQQLALQRLSAEELERRLVELSGLAEPLQDLAVRIHVATLVGGDSSPSRHAVVITRGEADGVRLGDWVAAGAPRDESDPAASGRELLARQWLLGKVRVAHAFTSEVLLITDPAFGPERVYPARLSEGGGVFGERECLLYGAGSHAEIRAAAENYLRLGFTDVVVRLPTNRPLSLPIGRIVGAEPLRESALHFDLRVEPCGDVRRVTRVYVISLAREP